MKQFCTILIWRTRFCAALYALIYRNYLLTIFYIIKPHITGQAVHLNAIAHQSLYFT